MASTNDMLDTLMSKKGQIVTMCTVRPAKVRKGRDPIEKHSQFQCRVGVNYDNIAAVKEKRESGELPKENAGLPWGQWHVFPYVIEHKGEYYFRCTTLNGGHRWPAKYYRNGVEISAEEAKADCLASEFSEKKSISDVFTIKVSSIVEVK